MPENERTPETFDQAMAEAREMMEQQAAQQETGTDAQTAEAQTEVQAQQSSRQEPAEGAVAQPQPSQTDPMSVIAGMQQQMNVMAAENQRLTQLLNEQSAAAQQSAVREAETPAEPLTPPELDLSDLWSADEDTLRQRQQEYSGRMAEYTAKTVTPMIMRQVMKELNPYIEDARKGQAEREMQASLEGLSQVPELGGIMEMVPTLRKIIETNPAIAGGQGSVEDKLITAYAIAKGAEAIKNPPKSPTAEDFMRMYDSDPGLQRQVEARRAQRAVDAAQQAVPLSAGAGAANAPLTPQKEPKDFDEMFRMLSGQYQ